MTETPQEEIARLYKRLEHLNVHSTGRDRIKQRISMLDEMIKRQENAVNGSQSVRNIETYQRVVR
jgi:hypothetical protein